MLTVQHQEWCHALSDLASVAASGLAEPALLRRGLEVLKDNLGLYCGEVFRVQQGQLSLEQLQNCRVGCPLGGRSLELAQQAMHHKQSQWEGRLVALPLVVEGQVKGVFVLRLSDNPQPSEESFLHLGTQLVALGLQHAAEVGRLSRRDAQRSTLMHQLLFAQEEERRRVGRDLHDQVGSLLTGALLALQVTERKPEYLAEAREAVLQALEEVRRVSRELRPAVLDDLGLVKALERYLQEFKARTQLQVQVQLESPPLLESQQIAVFRVIQEALTNVARHAKASRISVSLTALNRRLQGVVQDDGQGFVLGANPTVGLIGMRERIEQLGGSFEVHSEVGQGTQVRFVVPL